MERECLSVVAIALGFAQPGATAAKRFRLRQRLGRRSNQHGYSR